MSTLSGNDTVLFGPEPNPGDRLGNYILDRKLGSGGMGHVWKAIHELTGKPYAIKLLPPIIASNPDAWDQVRRNFDIIENLNHPHICAVKVLDRDPKFGPYLVMAHVEGMTLNKYRQGRSFTPEQVAAILNPVAEALDFAHSRKVIHRDIKHENIMVVLADDGQTIVDTYVIDFGLAAESRTVVTQFSQQSAPLAGTLRYMAPELWRGRPPVPASDQYALAVIAYELLAGYFPIDGVDRGIMREAVLNEAVEPISGQAASVNEALLKGLAKNPQDRFEPCHVFVTAVDAAHSSSIANREVQAEASSVVETDPSLISAIENHFVAMEVAAYEGSDSLTLRKGKIDDLEDFVENASPLPRLLDVQLVEFINDSKWADSDFAVLSEMQNIRHLAFCGCGGLGDESLLNLQKIARLESLDLEDWNCRDATEEGMRSIGNLKQLKWLKLPDGLNCRSWLTGTLQEQKLGYLKLVNYLRKCLPTTEIMMQSTE